MLHTGALAGALRDQPLRPWLAASIAGDLVDIASTVAGREQLPESAPRAAVIVAGASALVSAALLVTLEA